MEDTEFSMITPWFTKSCLEFLKQVDLRNFSVFEYGTGYSRPWWLVNCRFVNSVDHDKKWAYAFGAELEEDKETYISAPRDYAIAEYDIIVVDGVHREDCVKFVLGEGTPFLKSKGMLIIDNYGQEDYNIAETEDLLKGFTKLTFKQVNHSSWVTAVFVKP